MRDFGEEGPSCLSRVAQRHRPALAFPRMRGPVGLGVAMRGVLAASGLVTIVSSAGACSRRLPPEAPRDFGDLAAAPPDARASLALARAILDKDVRPATPPSLQLPGRRVVLVLWRGGQASVATAN